jgi:hypothetical protein
MRRRWRRRIVVGGAILLAAGGTAAAIKLSQKDVQRIEQDTGVSAEELTEEELLDAMERLGIEKLELTPEDQSAVAGTETETPTASPAQASPATGAGAPPPADTSYLEELERLADLRDRGVITDEDFQAKKKQLLEL